PGDHRRHPRCHGPGALPAGGRAQRAARRGAGHGPGHRAGTDGRHRPDGRGDRRCGGPVGDRAARAHAHPRLPRGRVHGTHPGRGRVPLGVRIRAPRRRPRDARSLPMTTQTASPPTVAIHPVSFPRIVRSEWIKFWSLRSTYWALAATLVAMVLMSLLMAVGASQAAQNPEFGPGPDGAMVISLSYAMAQLAIAVLGVLMISGEYSTGMIRSTLTAVPARIPALAAKAVIITVVSFVVGVVGVMLSYVITAPMLGDAGGAADLGDPEVQRLIWGTGLYLAAV